MIINDKLVLSFEQFPNKVAAEDSSKKLTYRQLDEDSNRLAFYLKQSGVSNGDVVAIYLDACVDYVVAVVAVLKVGAVFAPLNTKFPAKRQAMVFDRLKPTAVITNVSFASALEQQVLEIGRLDENKSSYRITDDHIVNINSAIAEIPSDAISDPAELANVKIQPGDSCYIITTSGSTGEPKSIICDHKGLEHFINWEINEFNIDQSANVSLMSAVTFDVSLRDIFVPLSTGGKLHIPDETIKNNPRELLGWLTEKKISLCHMVPTVFRLLTGIIPAFQDKDRILPDLKFILLAGEALYGNDVNNWRSAAGTQTQLVNIYGPSETTLAKLFCRIENMPFEAKDIIPLGKPLPDTEICIINDGKRMRDGQSGEIYIKTPFRSKGYVNDAEQTKKVFVPDTFFDDSFDIIYKTGDLGKISADGIVHFEGRLDGQVKLFGKRIELGEIEVSLGKHPLVNQVAVAVKNGALNNSRLVAYIVLDGSEKPTVESLRNYISKTLPDYMVPALYHFLPAMPLTHSGKIDRKALPEPDHSRPEMEREYVVPSGEIEKMLSDIWCRVLQLDRVGTQDNFFDLGGDSVLTTQLNLEIQKKTGREIAIVKLYQYPTISDFARFLTENNSNDETNQNIQGRADMRRAALKRRRKIQL